MNIIKNYHTHTYRCQHASGDVEDYCQAAVEQGLQVLGISDHTALPDDRWPNVRMAFSDLPDYTAAIDADLAISINSTSLNKSCLAQQLVRTERS